MPRKMAFRAGTEPLRKQGLDADAGTDVAGIVGIPTIFVMADPGSEDQVRSRRRA